MNNNEKWVPTKKIFNHFKTLNTLSNNKKK